MFVFRLKIIYYANPVLIKRLKILSGIFYFANFNKIYPFILIMTKTAFSCLKILKNLLFFQFYIRIIRNKKGLCFADFWQAHTKKCLKFYKNY